MPKNPNPNQESTCFKTGFQSWKSLPFLAKFVSLILLTLNSIYCNYYSLLFSKMHLLGHYREVTLSQ